MESQIITTDNKWLLWTVKVIVTHVINHVLESVISRKHWIAYRVNIFKYIKCCNVVITAGVTLVSGEEAVEKDKSPLNSRGGGGGEQLLH